MIEIVEYRLSVKFPRHIESVLIKDNNLYETRYDYLSPVPVDAGGLVVVPTYSDHENIRLAEVASCTPDDGRRKSRNGKLRYIIDVVDTESYEHHQQLLANRKRALALLEEAMRERSQQRLFDEVAADLPEDQRKFVAENLGLRLSIPSTKDKGVDEPVTPD